MRYTLEKLFGCYFSIGFNKASNYLENLAFESFNLKKIYMKKQKNNFN